MIFLITFIALSIVNVVFSTIRSIATIKSGKAVASLLSGGYFAFYNVMLIYTVTDFPMWQKCSITFVCNVVGVWVVKFFEEKAKKDKLWKIEVTVKKGLSTDLLKEELEKSEIPFNYLDINKYTLFNIYCATQKESSIVKMFIGKLDVKYFVTETKSLY